jgi:hypothetical protein
MFMRARDLVAALRYRPMLTIGAYLSVALTLATLALWSFAEVVTGIIGAANLNAPRATSQASAAVAAVTRQTAPPGRDERDIATARDGDPNPDTKPPEVPSARQPGIPARTIVNSAEDPLAEFVSDNGDTYRTVCVRLCDGYFWPVSFATSSSSIAADRDQCDRSCGSPTRLYIHRVPGSSPEEMVDLSGAPYTRLPTAFRFRTTFDASCKCTAHPWEQAAKDRHRLYALEEAASKGDRQAIRLVAEARARVNADKRQELAEKRRANAQLVAAGVVSTASAMADGPPPSLHPRAPGATPHRVAERLEGGMMGLGGPRDNGRGGLPPVVSSGGGPGSLGAIGSRSGGDWRNRVFNGN